MKISNPQDPDMPNSLQAEAFIGKAEKHAINWPTGVPTIFVLEISYQDCKIPVALKFNPRSVRPSYNGMNTISVQLHRYKNRIRAIRRII